MARSRKRINGRWVEEKTSKVVAPSDERLFAKTISGDFITQKLITEVSNNKGSYVNKEGKVIECVSSLTYTTQGKIMKKRKRTNKANKWNNGFISDNYREFHNIPTKGNYSEIDLRGINKKNK